jgi:DNA-directed RNA polymerase alpha subunit
MPPPNRRYKTSGRKGPDTSSWSPEERAAHERAKKLQTPVAELALSVRIINTLEENDVILVETLMTQTYESLLAMKNFGEKTLTEVRAAIATLGLVPPEWKKPPKEKKPPKPKGGFMGGGVW